MAYTKKSTSKNKALHTAELTTGQLVLAVCTFLIVLLGVFLLGIIVGEYQYKMRETRQVAQAEPPAEPGEGTQPGAFSEVKRDSAPAAPEPYRAPSDRAAASVIVAAPDPTAARPPETANVEKTPLAPPASTPKPADPPPPAPSPASAPAPVPLEPIEVADDLPEVADADTADDSTSIDLLPDEPETAPSKPAAETAKPAATGKVYSVQVAALSEPKNAESMKKRLEATTSWPVDVVLNPAKKLHIVYVGRFKTEAEAEKARRELRKKPEFAEAFTNSRTVN